VHMNLWERLSARAVDDDLVNEIFSKFCMGK